MTAGVVLAFLMMSVACRGERRTQSGDSVVGRVPPVPGDVHEPEIVVWNAALGRVMVLSMPEFPDSVMLLGPDYVQDRYSDTATFDWRRISGAQVELFGRGSAVGTGVLSAGVYRRSGDQCVGWPTAGIATGHKGWTVGFEAGVARVIPLDSLERLRGADSARFVVEIVRMAAAIPETHDEVFSSVPFFVLRGYRYQIGDTLGMIGIVRRSIPSEAYPREERVFFVAERGKDAAEYRVRFVDREVGEGDVGDGESPGSVDIWALVSVAGRAMMVVGYMYTDGWTVGIIERGAGGVWDGTWQSAHTGC